MITDKAKLLDLPYDLLECITLRLSNPLDILTLSRSCRTFYRLTKKNCFRESWVFRRNANFDKTEGRLSQILMAIRFSIVTPGMLQVSQYDSKSDKLDSMDSNLFWRGSLNKLLVTSSFPNPKEKDFKINQIPFKTRNLEKTVMISCIEEELGKQNDLKTLWVCLGSDLALDWNRVLRILWGEGHHHTAILFINELVYSQEYHSKFQKSPIKFSAGMLELISDANLELLLRHRLVDLGSVALAAPERLLNPTLQQPAYPIIPFVLKNAIIKNQVDFIEKMLNSKWLTSSQNPEAVKNWAFQLAQKLGHKHLAKVIKLHL